jgi:hypothetical protein
MPYLGKEPARVPVTSADIPNDSITVDKLADSINTEITDNTTKVTNATHTGDVTGATALTIATDAVTTTKILDGAITAAKINSAVALGGPSLGTASVIRTNAQTISENITIGSTTNGMSAGPITIADSYTVTVNGNWSIV